MKARLASRSSRQRGEKPTRKCVRLWQQLWVGQVLVSLAHPGRFQDPETWHGRETLSPRFSRTSSWQSASRWPVCCLPASTDQGRVVPVRQLRHPRPPWPTPDPRLHRDLRGRRRAAARNPDLCGAPALPPIGRLEIASSTGKRRCRDFSRRAGKKNCELRLISLLL